MKWAVIFVVIAAAAVGGYVILNYEPENTTQVEEQDPNSQRIAVIKSVIKSTQESGVQFSSKNALAAAVLPELAKVLPILPIKGSEEYQAIMKEIKTKMKMSYPDSDNDAQLKFMIAAEKKYKLAVVGETMTIHYKLGAKTESITGVYHGIKGKNIVIGYKNIPKLDLAADSLAKFDELKHKVLVDSFVEENFNAYIKVKKTFRKEVIQDTIGSDMTRALNAGYVRYKNKWMSVQDAVYHILNIYTDEEDAEK